MRPPCLLAAALLVVPAAATKNNTAVPFAPHVETQPFQGLSCSEFKFNAHSCSCDMVIDGAVVRFTDGYNQAADVLMCDACRPQDAFIFPYFDNTAGVLELSGDRTLAEYAAVVAELWFLSTEESNVTKRLTYNFGKAVYRPETQHFYQFGKATPGNETCFNAPEQCSWDAAQRACASPDNDLFGMVGYLFAPDQPEELDFADTIKYPNTAPGVKTTAWIGCSDYGSERNFRWAVGPNACPAYYDRNAATVELRSACDLGYPFTQATTSTQHSHCAGAHCNMGSLPAAAIWAAGEPHQSWTTNLQEDFCRQASPDTIKMADAPGIYPVGTPHAQRFYCEFGGVGTGTPCLAMEDLTGTAELVPVPLDECRTLARPMPHRDVYDSAAGSPATAVLGTRKLNCSEIAFAPGCDCSTIIPAAFVTIEAGGQLGDDIVCPDCDANGVLLKIESQSMGWRDRRFPVVAGVIRNATDAAAGVPLEAMIAVMNTVGFVPRQGSVTMRSVTWNFGSGWYVPATKSYYQYFRIDVPWEDAVAACQSPGLDFLGLTGYLATITSDAESRISLRFGDDGGWLGATDAGGSAERWRWINGPEGCGVADLAAAPPGRTACGIFPIEAVCGPGAAGCGLLGTLIAQGARNFTQDTFVPEAGMYNRFASSEPSNSYGLEHYMWYDGVDGLWEDHSDRQVSSYLCEWSDGMGALCAPHWAVRGTRYFIPRRYVCAHCVTSLPDCGAGQSCRDTAGANNWECACDPPAAGFAVGTTATCSLDECAGVRCDFGQTCDDKNTSSPGDWQCECAPPMVGSAVGANATCSIFLNECLSVGGVICHLGGQTCHDANATVGSLHDWQCLCNPPAAGSAVGATATCTYDECGAAARCRAGQTCVDNNKNEDRTGDWMCTCDPPAAGVPQVGRDADCTLDECRHTCPTCAPAEGCAARQLCQDTGPNTLSDWECVCEDPPITGVLPGVKVGGNATCEYDECDEYARMCHDAFQTCVDQEYTRPDTWECLCSYPNGTSVSTPLGPAVCFYNECEESDGGLTGSAICGGQDPVQVCRDPYPHPGMVHLSDWVCECVPPNAGLPAQKRRAICEEKGTPVPLSTRVDPNPQFLPTPAPQSLAPADANATSAPAMGASMLPDVALRRGFSDARRASLKRMTVFAEVVALALGGSTGALGVGQLAVLRNLDCPAVNVPAEAAYEANRRDREALDWELSPTGAALWSGDTTYLLGAAVINAVLVLGCVLGLYLLAYVAPVALGDILKAEGGQPVHTKDKLHAALAFFHAPGVTYIPFLILQMGTAHACGRLLFSVSVSGLTSASIGAMVLCLYLFGNWLVCTEVLQKVARKAAAVRDPRLCPDDHAAAHEPEDGLVELEAGCLRHMYRYAFGDVVWVSKDGQYFCEKYGVIFACFRAGKVWWALVQASVGYVVAFIGAWHPTATMTCNLRNVGLCFVLVLAFAILVWARPYAAPLHNALDAGVTGCLAVAAVVLTAAIMAGADYGSAMHDVSAGCLVAAVCVAALKAVVLVVSSAVDVWLKRTATIRRVHTEDRPRRCRGDPADRSHFTMQSTTYAVLPEQQLLRPLAPETPQRHGNPLYAPADGTPGGESNSACTTPRRKTSTGEDEERKGRELSQQRSGVHATGWTPPLPNQSFADASNASGDNIANIAAQSPTFGGVSCELNKELMRLEPAVLLRRADTPSRRDPLQALQKSPMRQLATDTAPRRAVRRVSDQAPSDSFSLAGLAASGHSSSRLLPPLASVGSPRAPLRAKTQGESLANLCRAEAQALENVDWSASLTVGSPAPSVGPTGTDSSQHGTAGSLPSPRLAHAFAKARRIPAGSPTIHTAASLEEL